MFISLNYISGTLTGQAITFVTEELLKESSGNRRGVQDIVLVITDGVSQDDVSEPSRKLRETGAQVRFRGDIVGIYTDCVFRRGGILRRLHSKGCRWKIVTGGGIFGNL